MLKSSLSITGILVINKILLDNMCMYFFVFVYRRPVAVRVKDIGVWLQIMESLGRISVVTNVII
jgi:hypothetical protein